MRKYTPEEDQYIRDNFLSQTLQQMGDHLGRPFGSVAGRLKLLGLELPAEIKEQRKRIGITAGWEKAYSTRFKKGQIPTNKGKKMSPELKEKVRHTFFQKGHLPHNTRHDGATRVNVDGYIEVRTSLRVWKLKHRLVWEEHNGPIPEGYNVVFKDQNRLNCNIDNLELISRKENMLRNTIHNYPEEIKTAIHRLSKLNKTIKKQSHE